MMHATVRFRAALLLAFVCAAAPAAAQKRNITETDLLKFVWIADPQISPDGSHVALVRVDVNEKADTYDTSIWIVATDGKEPRAPPHRRDPRSHAALVARREPARLRPRRREGRPGPAAADLRDVDGRRRRAGGYRDPARRRQPGVVAGWLDDCLFLHRPGRRSENAGERRHDRRSGERGEARVGRQGHHAGGLPRQRRRRFRLRRSGSSIALLDRRGAASRRQHPGDAKAGHLRRVRRRQPQLVAPMARRSTSSPTAAANRTTCRATATSMRSPKMAASPGRSPASTAGSAPIPWRRTASASPSSARWHGTPERSYSQRDLWVVDEPGRHAAESDR